MVGVSYADSSFCSILENSSARSTVVPIIRLSDQTQLTNFSGDKKAWPVYLTIGNILSQTRNSPAKMPILPLALLPVPPKLKGESAPADKAPRQTNADALRAVFDLVLAPLQEVVQEGTVIYCANGKTGLCFPILSAWIADHAEHAALHEIGSKSCPMCEVACKELGGDPRKIYEARDYALYWEKAQKQESGEAGIAEYFQQVGVKIGRNEFAELYPVNPADLHKPDVTASLGDSRNR